MWTNVISIMLITRFVKAKKMILIAEIQRFEQIP